MKFIGTTLSVLFGLTLLGLIGAGVYYAFHFIIDSLFEKLDPKLAAIATIAAATLLICTSIIANPKVTSQFIKVLLEIRKDLGLSNQGFDGQELLMVSGGYPKEANQQTFPGVRP